MKSTFLILIASMLTISVSAQKASKKETAKTDSTNKVVAMPEKKYNCDSVVVDFETGLLNGKIGLSSPIDSIKKYLPCVSTEIPFASDERACGGGAILEKPGIFFNLENGFIEFT